MQYRNVPVCLKRCFSHEKYREEVVEKYQDQFQYFINDVNKTLNLDPSSTVTMSLEIYHPLLLLTKEKIKRNVIMQKRLFYCTIDENKFWSFPNHQSTKRNKLIQKLLWNILRGIYIMFRNFYGLFMNYKLFNPKTNVGTF